MNSERNLIYLLTITILLCANVWAQADKSVSGTEIRAEALNNQGVKLADAEKFAEAIELFRQAINLRPDYFIAYGNLGATLYRAGKIEEAVAALNKAVELNPDFATAISDLGAVHAASGELDKAVEFFNRAISLQPDFALAHYTWAVFTSGRKNLKNPSLRLNAPRSLIRTTRKYSFNQVMR